MKIQHSICILFLVFSLSALASTKRENEVNCFSALSRSFQSTETSLNIQNLGASLHFETSLKDSLREVNSNLLLVKKPEGYQIKLHERIEHTTSFNGPINASGEIIVSENYAVINKVGKVHSISPKYSLAIAIHEYGHEVFAQNIASYITHSEVLEVLKGREIIRSSMQKIAILEEKVTSLMKNGLDKNKLIEHPDFIMFSKTSNFIREGLSLYAKGDFKNILAPYDELFADLIAVIGTNDPRAMYRANSAGGRDGNSRDFLAQVAINNWRNDSAHRLFNPVRSHLWKNYLSHPEFKKEKPKIIKALLRAMAKEIDFYAKTRLGDLPHVKNLRLIDTFDEEFKTLVF